MINEIRFTEQAIKKIDQLIKEKPFGTYFRISVKGGGCSGFKYDFSFDKNLERNDQSGIAENGFQSGMIELYSPSRTRGKVVNVFS